MSQSIIYHQVRRYLLRLDADNQHLQNWRPSVLLLVAPGRVNTHLLEFCNSSVPKTEVALLLACAA